MNGVTEACVRKIVKSKDADAQKCSKAFEHKNEQSTADILEYMEKRKAIVCDIMDKYLDELQNSDKIAKATVSQLTTALGTLIDKFTMAKDFAQGEKAPSKIEVTIRKFGNTKSGEDEGNDN